MRAVMSVMLAGVLVTSGCSFGTTRPPNHADPDDNCNTSEVGPVLDAAWAVLFGLSTVVAGVDSNSADNAPVLISLGFTALFAGAAAYGFNNVRKCRDREREIDERVAQDERAPKKPRMPTARDQAWLMTKQARTAAVEGDCATVQALGEAVQGADPDFFTGVFKRDPGLARCLAAAPAADQEIPVSPPGPPPTAAPVSPY